MSSTAHVWPWRPLEIPRLYGARFGHFTSLIFVLETLGGTAHTRGRFFGRLALWSPHRGPVLSGSPFQSPSTR